jgi:NAD(P)-dependent dehydrogenase (short-subunit alcohol dehydrogenase family)
VVLITGAGSGIGRATAILLASEGAVVLVADISVDAAQAVADEIAATGGKAETVLLDVAKEGDWRHAIEQAFQNHERLDVLVNNAGISFAKPIDQMTLDEWQKVLSVNLDGVFLGTKHAIAAMKKSGGGSIVNLASVSGIKPSPTASAYCASKAAIRMFSKTAAIECADAKTGIRVNLVTPGGVKTPMWEKMEFFQGIVAQTGGTEKAFAALEGATASQKFFTAEEVASSILYLASDESSHLTGTEIVLDRGHNAVLISRPKLTDDALLVGGVGQADAEDGESFGRADTDVLDLQISRHGSSSKSRFNPVPPPSGSHSLHVHPLEPIEGEPGFASI